MLSRIKVMYIVKMNEYFFLQGYKERWQTSPDCPLTERQMEDLFSNIQDIYHFNR